MLVWHTWNTHQAGLDVQVYKVQETIDLGQSLFCRLYQKLV